MGAKASGLQLERTNLHLDTNASAHQTDAFVSKALIVRRGQPFTIDIIFNKPLQTLDKLKLNLNTGTTNIDLPIEIPSSGSNVSWSVSSALNGNTLTLSINSPVNAVIGRYAMRLGCPEGFGTTWKGLGTVYVLFNPWAKGDAVYMEKDDDKREYVLNEMGLIFFRSQSYASPRPWDYGQYEEGILDISLSLLDASIDHRRDLKHDMTQRNDAVHVGRVLSAMINSQNDNGVIVGNWSANYSGGESPTVWNGSTDILRKWMEKGPVKFGQCWVYAGVLCTVLRCLGIPARVITNFSSAHDTDENLVVDRYFDEKGVESEETADSVWNFHCWVEAWFARPDIGSAYDGWQVLDGTPQEPSEGQYRLGPCSVNAIKEGDVDLEYDAPFVFAEVNADVTYWLLYPDHSKKKIRTDISAVGQLTCTKAVGTSGRADITNNYKYPEGTPKEREIFEKAVAKLSSTNFGSIRGTVALSAVEAEATPEPNFTGHFKHGNIEVGQDVTFSLDLKNTMAEDMSVQVNLTASAIIYTNTSVKNVLTNTQSVKLGASGEHSITYTVPYTEYLNSGSSDIIKVVAVCEDQKGGKLLVRNVIFLKKPSVLIKVTEQAILNKPVSVEIEFTNPTEEELMNCVLTIDGSGLVKEQIKRTVAKLDKNETHVNKVEIVPYRHGERCLVVDFSSDKISVKGFLTIKVAST